MRSYKQLQIYIVSAMIGVLQMSLSTDASDTIKPLGWKWTYDGQDRLSSLVDPSGRETKYDYITGSNTGIQQLTRINQDGSKVSWKFGDNGAPKTMSDNSGVVSYDYDDLGRINRIQRNNAPAIVYAYNTLDQIKSLKIGDFYSIEYMYDFLGRIESVKTPAGEIKYEYLTGQGFLIRTLPNGIKTIRRYEPGGQLQQITHTDAGNIILAEYTYQYRPDGLIDAIRERSGRGENIQSFEYDTVGRLIGMSDSSGKKYEYDYDLLGNRLKVTTDGIPTQTCSYDWFGRLEKLDDNSCEHDAAGNLTAVTVGGISLKYGYNQDNQLAEVLGGKAVYRYDGNGQLIARKTGDTESVFIPNPLSDLWQPLVIEEKSRKSTLVIWEGNTPLVIIRDGKPEYLLQDHLGSVRLLADTKGRVARQFDYEPFGNILAPTENEEFAPRFAGLFWDPQAKAYLTMARAYSPSISRWLQIEPLKTIPTGAQKELSLYAYCGGDSVNYIDIGGTSPQRIGENVNTWLDNHIEWLPKWRAMSPQERFDDFKNATMSGRLFGTRLGEQAAELYANRLTTTGNWGYYIPGSLASLWTKETFAKTTFVLAGGWAASGWAATTGPTLGQAWSSASVAVQTAWTRAATIVTTPLIAKGIEHGSKNEPFHLPFLPDSVRYVFGNPHWGFGSHGWHAAVSYIHMYQDRLWTPYTGSIPNFLIPGLINQYINNNIDNSVDFGSALSPSSVGGVYLGGAGNSLAGLGLLDGISLDSNNNLVLISQDNEEIKLPPLRLDDVVTVFRSVYLYGEGPTVTIDPNPENPEGSAMIIRHSKATENTYVGWVLYQADRLMKGYNLGKDNITTEQMNSTVAGYSDVLDTIYFGGEDPEKMLASGHWERFWIVSAESRRYEGLRRELSLFDIPLKVKTQSMIWDKGQLVDDPKGKSSPGATAFTRWFTDQYDRIAEERFLTPPKESGIQTPVPVFTELRRIALITAIAEKLRDQGVPMPFWMRDYQVPSVPFEQFTPGLTVTRSNQHVTARVFGGVELSVADKDVKIFTKDADMTKLEKPDQIAVREKLVLADSLEKALRLEAGSIEPLKAHKFSCEGKKYTVAALPGAQTQALTPCRMEEIDLTVSTGSGYSIQLVRSYNSFFDPSGVLGKGWVLDLPQLEEIKVPVQRDGKEVKYQVAYELITPLNTIYARFARVEKVSALGGKCTLQVPDKDGEFFGLADDKPDFLSGPTHKLLRKDGVAWHFSEAGQLVATEQDGVRTVYERDEKGRITRIVGLLGRNAVAFITLQYDLTNRLTLAEGKNAKTKEVIRYEYNESGRLAGVQAESGRLGYRYEGSLMTAITHQPKNISEKKTAEITVRQFKYNSFGQLLSETDHNGVQTAFRIASSATGNTLTLTQPQDGTKTTSIRYDMSYRLAKADYADGTKISWSYPENGDSIMQITDAEGRKGIITESPKQHIRTLELNTGYKIIEENDAEGRLVSLQENGKVILSQKWYPDGRLDNVSDGNCTAHYEYDSDGLTSSVLLSPPNEQGEFKHWQKTKLDAAGRPVEISDYRGMQIFANYNDAGELISVVSKQDDKNYGFKIRKNQSEQPEEIQSSWGTQRFVYDTTGLVTKWEMEKDGTTASAEWKSGLIQKTKQFDGGEFSFCYYEKSTRSNMLKEIITPNRLSVNYSYNKSNQLSQVAVGQKYNLALGYDNKGRLVEWRYVPLER